MKLVLALLLAGTVQSKTLLNTLKNPQSDDSSKITAIDFNKDGTTDYYINAAGHMVDPAGNIITAIDYNQNGTTDAYMNEAGHMVDPAGKIMAGIDYDKDGNADHYMNAAGNMVNPAGNKFTGVDYKKDGYNDYYINEAGHVISIGDNNNIITDYGIDYKKDGVTNFYINKAGHKVRAAGSNIKKSSTSYPSPARSVEEAGCCQVSETDSRSAKLYFYTVFGHKFGENKDITCKSGFWNPNATYRGLTQTCEMREAVSTSDNASDHKKFDFIGYKQQVQSSNLPYEYAGIVRETAALMNKCRYCDGMFSPLEVDTNIDKNNKQQQAKYKQELRIRVSLKIMKQQEEKLKRQRDNERWQREQVELAKEAAYKAELKAECISYGLSFTLCEKIHK